MEIARPGMTPLLLNFLCSKKKNKTKIQNVTVLAILEGLEFYFSMFHGPSISKYGPGPDKPASVCHFLPFLVIQ